MEEVNIRLNINEVNTILEALGNLPYGRVYQLVVSIQNQAREQLGSNGAAENAQPEAMVSQNGKSK